MMSRVHFVNRFSFRSVYLVLGLCWLIVLVMFGNASWRNSIRQFFVGSDRKVLASLNEDLTKTGQMISVIKVREKGLLYLEFYSQKKASEGEETAESLEKSDQSIVELIQKLQMPNSIDGYVTFMGQASNLAVANLDDDPILELLVPSFNLEFAPFLDVVKYNTAEKRFKIMPAFSIPQDLIQGIRREGM